MYECQLNIKSVPHARRGLGLLYSTVYHFSPQNSHFSPVLHGMTSMEEGEAAGGGGGGEGT